MFLTGSLVAAQAADPDKPKPRKAKPAAKSVSAEIQEMKQALAEQQKQIQDLQQQLHQRDQDLQQTQQQLQQVQSAVSDVQSKAQASSTASAQNTDAVSSLQSTVADLKTTATSAASAVEQTQKRVSDLESPAQIHFRGITITPGGFIEAAGLFRTHNENASVNSASGDYNIPLSGTTNAQMTEFRFDARQSRLSLLAEGTVHDVKATGYYEMDFLGAAPTANENQSNSFNLRQRQLWASAQFKSGWTLSAGQQWSLLTLSRSGIANRAEFVPLTINAQYVIGYDWARQPSFRLTKKFSKEFSAAVAVENPSTVVNAQGITIAPTTGSTPPVFGLNGSPNAQSPNGNFVLNYSSCSGFVSVNGTPTSVSAFCTTSANGVSTNLAPDVIAKITYDHRIHFEIKGIERAFRDRFNGQNNTTLAGGGGFGLIAPIVKSKLDLIAEGLAGSGIGRYGSGGGIDVTLRPAANDNAELAAIRSYHMLAGPEIHAGKHLDIYAYGGEEYYDRNYIVTGATSSVGYGSPLLNNTNCSVEQTAGGGAPSCPNQTRYAWEFTPGFWYRFWKGSSGTVQWGMQYSYSKRALWEATGGAPKGNDNQVYTSFRYYLP
jgi:uncharacterized protein YoxC